MAGLITVLKIVQYTISILNGQTVACSIRDLELTDQLYLKRNVNRPEALQAFKVTKHKDATQQVESYKGIEETFPLQSAFKCVTFYCPC